MKYCKVKKDVIVFEFLFLSLIFSLAPFLSFALNFDSRKKKFEPIRILLGNEDCYV